MDAVRMSQWIEIETPHGPVRAWRVDPGLPAHGAVVVLQEIFGVNDHIRQVAQRFAAAGFVALAPSLYDPVEAGVELGYDDAGVARGRQLREQLGFDRATDIVRACAQLLRREAYAVGTVGFCWGGSVAFLANTRLGLPAVSYYGARTVPFLTEPAKAPMLFHFGERDDTVSPADIALHRRHQPKAGVHVYPAGHGFNRDVDRRVYDAASASLAWERTVAFLQDALA